jgi:hypothetical protein
MDFVNPIDNLIVVRLCIPTQLWLKMLQSISIHIFPTYSEKLVGEKVPTGNTVDLWYIAALGHSPGSGWIVASNH